jgi:hypothetical protein
MPMTVTSAKPHRPNPLTFRKEPHMYAIELRRIVVEERQRQLLSDVRAFRAGRETRSIRQRLGESLIRLGRRVGGDPATTPAWQA